MLTELANSLKDSQSDFGKTSSRHLISMVFWEWLAYSKTLPRGSGILQGLKPQPHTSNSVGQNVLIFLMIHFAFYQHLRIFHS